MVQYLRPKRKCGQKAKGVNKWAGVIIVAPGVRLGRVFCLGCLVDAVMVIPCAVFVLDAIRVFGINDHLALWTLGVEFRTTFLADAVRDIIPAWIPSQELVAVATFDLESHGHAPFPSEIFQHNLCVGRDGGCVLRFCHRLQSLYDKNRSRFFLSFPQLECVSPFISFHLHHASDNLDCFVRVGVPKELMPSPVAFFLKYQHIVVVWFTTMSFVAQVMPSHTSTVYRPACSTLVKLSLFVALSFFSTLLPCHWVSVHDFLLL